MPRRTEGGGPSILEKEVNREDSTSLPDQMDVSRDASPEEMEKRLKTFSVKKE